MRLLGYFGNGSALVHAIVSWLRWFGGELERVARYVSDHGAPSSVCSAVGIRPRGVGRCRCGLCEVNLDGWRLLFQRRRAGNGLVRFSGRALEVTLCAQTFFG